MNLNLKLIWNLVFGARWIVAFGLFVWVLIILFYWDLAKDLAVDNDISFSEQRRFGRMKFAAHYVPYMLAAGLIVDVVSKYRKAMKEIKSKGIPGSGE